MRCQALLRNRSLAIDLTHGLIDDLLLERIHERLSGGRVVCLRGSPKLANARLQRPLRCGEARLRRRQSRLLRRRQGSSHTLCKSRLLSRHGGHLSGIRALPHAGQGGNLRCPEVRLGAL